MRRAAMLYLGRGRDGERPPLATTVFWVGLIGAFAARLVEFDARTLPVWYLGPPAVVLLVLWPGLDWKPGRRWPVMVAFALAAITFSALEGSGTSLLLILVVLTNVVLTTGVWAGLTAAALLAAIVLVSVPLLYGKPWDDAALQAAGGLVIGGATVAVAQVISAEQRRRLEAARLLGELRDAHDDLKSVHAQLADAHAQLKARADQTRELAVAEERARLSREVHDAVGHHLTVVKLGLTNAVRLRGRDGQAAWEEVEEARSSATTALDEVRRAVRAMGPGPLARTTLGTALRDLVTSYTVNGLRAQFTVTGAVRPLGPAVDATLYRVTEEALTNVARHATGATSAEVRLTFRPGEVTLTVDDDGRATTSLTPGFGLAGARSRLAEVGGTLSLNRRDNGGVQIRATVTAPAKEGDGADA